MPTRILARHCPDLLTMICMHRVPDVPPRSRATASSLAAIVAAAAIVLLLAWIGLRPAADGSGGSGLTTTIALVLLLAALVAIGWSGWRQQRIATELREVRARLSGLDDVL